MTRFTILIAFLISLSFIGCGDDHDHDHDHGKEASGSHDDHDHDKEGHDEHDHGGERHELGKGEHDGVAFTATQLGEPAKGEMILEVAVTAGGEKVKAVRAWIGAADGKGAVKAKANKAKGEKYDIHVEMPAEHGEDAKVHVEIETAAGAKAFGFAFEHDDHEHEKK